MPGNTGQAVWSYQERTHSRRGTGIVQTKGLDPSPEQTVSEWL